MSGDLPSRSQVARRAFRVALVATVGLWAVLFVPAGTLAYWEAWRYMAILLVPMLFVVRYLLREAPDLLARRMQLRRRCWSATSRGIASTSRSRGTG